MKYKAVIFDLFGTLVDNYATPEYFRVLEEMSATLGASPEPFCRLWSGTFNLRVTGAHKTHQDSIRHICEELGVSVTGAQIEEAAAIRLQYTIETLKPRPDTLPTILHLKQLGYQIALVSDCSPETPAAWPMTPFKGIFDVTVFSCEAGMKKPDSRIYRLAADGLGVAPEDCLYVGDGSSTELTGAKKVGMHPVLILDPGEDADTHFIDREKDWQGPRISYLKEVLRLL